jgi:nitroimidazol reductase NimA-like FMN-containing flavoprotein (pyridoxamine 5'-phosphate oxidase superfamily)
MRDLTREESLDLLDRAEVAHVAVIADGEPYVSPISFVRHGEELMLRTGPGRRLDALRHNPLICLEVTEVDDVGGWMSVIVSGRARRIDDEMGEAHAVRLLLEKYKELEGPVTQWTVPELLPGTAAVLVISMDRLSGRGSGSGPERQTRPGRL